MSESISNFALIEDCKALRRSVSATDVLSDSEKDSLLENLDAVLACESLLGVAKVKVLAQQVMKDVLHELEIAVANAEWAQAKIAEMNDGNA
jgi:hypothetical protein